MLMLMDREEISRGLAESLEYKEIGRGLGRDSSVISREVARPYGCPKLRARPVTCSFVRGDGQA